MGATEAGIDEVPFLLLPRDGVGNAVVAVLRHVVPPVLAEALDGVEVAVAVGALHGADLVPPDDVASGGGALHVVQHLVLAHGRVALHVDVHRGELRLAPGDVGGGAFVRLARKLELLPDAATDDAVGLPAVAALEALDRLPGGLVEVAVDGALEQPALLEFLLELEDRRAGGTDRETALRLGLRGGLSDDAHMPRYRPRRACVISGIRVRGLHFAANFPRRLGRKRQCIQGLGALTDSFVLAQSTSSE